MKTRRLISFLLFVGAFSLSAQLQPWVSADGLHRFQGEFVSLEGDIVTLRDPGGTEVPVPILRLDQESRNRALTLSLPPDTPGRRVLFSHFTDHYRLTLHNHHDVARIQFREAGRPVEYPPMILRIQHVEVSGNVRTDRDFRAMDGEVRLEENTVIWRARMQSEGIVEVRIQLLPDGIDFGYRIEFPSARPSDPRLSMVSVVPPVLEFDPDLQLRRGIVAPNGVETDRIPALLRSFSVRYRSLDNRTTTLPYTESRTETLSDLGRVELRGPYTRNPITFHAPDGRDTGEVRLWFYEGGRSLLDGPRVRHHYPELPESQQILAWFKLRFE